MVIDDIELETRRLARTLSHTPVMQQIVSDMAHALPTPDIGAEVKAWVSMVVDMCEAISGQLGLARDYSVSLIHTQFKLNPI